MNRTLLLVLLLLALPSCASIFARPSHTLLLTSTPNGLAFTTDYGATGVTPAPVSVPPSVRTVEITLTNAAGERRAYLQSKRPSYWIIGNLLFPGFLGAIVDVVNPGANVWPRGGDWHLEWDQGAHRAPQEPGL